MPEPPTSVEFARLRCCALHIGLVHIAYNAFLGDDDTLALTEARMLTFLDEGAS